MRQTTQARRSAARRQCSRGTQASRGMHEMRIPCVKRQGVGRASELWQVVTFSETLHAF